MNDFFEKAKKLDVLRKLEKPNGRDLQIVMEIIRGDKELARYFYGKNEQGVLSAVWLELLDGAGEFEELVAKDVEIVGRIKALYLVGCADSKPQEVLGIVTRINAQDPWIQGKFADAIAKMPEKIGVGGVPAVLEYISGREYKVWFFVGEPAAKLMVKLVDKQPKEAFELGKALLDVWRPGEKEARSSLDNIRARFATHEYKRLMFDFYCKVWEKRPLEATRLLVEIYDKYLDEYNKSKGYDTSEYLGISIEDLDNIERLDYDLEAIIVKGICDAGQTTVTLEKEKGSELLDYLEKRQKAIFYRVVMYLLRFMEAGVDTERVRRMVGNNKFIENSLYRYEHRLLLNEKFDEVGEEARNTFVEWVKQEKVSEKSRQEIIEWCTKNNKPIPDFEKMEYREKAEELYLVHERFKELYEEYKRKAGIKDDTDLAPRRMVSKAHFVSPEEGSPYSSEKMGKDKVEIVVNYLLELKNYKGKEKVSGWGTAKDALTASFKADVKKRPMEYLSIDLEKLRRLEPEFLEKLFYGVGEAVRDRNFRKEGWGRLIELAHDVVQGKNKEKGYKDCFSAILRTMRDGFTEKNNAIEFDNKTIETMWTILEALVKYDEDYETSSYERDPIQMRCNSVNGEALEQVVMLGIVCKKDFNEYYEQHLKVEIRKVLNYVVQDVKRPEVNCTLGIDLGRIGWIDAEWLRDNIEKIFEGEMWDVVWGTHVSWGRPSHLGFELLTAKGIYKKAIEKMGTPNKYEFGKDPDEGFVEHLMIGFFNGWIDIEDELLNDFFEKATAKLRGKAARFLTTGFKSVNEEGGEEKEKVAKRMKEYWEKRLEVVGENPEENAEEAVEFTGWVEDTLLEPKETLELLKQTLELSEGKFGQMRDVRDFIGGICELGKGNELIALQCLRKATADENMRMPWAEYEERVVEFLEQISKLPNDYENVEDILNEAVEVADLYGRLQPDKFRGIWEKINKRLRESKV